MFLNLSKVEGEEVLCHGLHRQWKTEIFFCQLEGSAQHSESCCREAGQWLITQLLVKLMQMLLEISAFHLQSTAADQWDLIVEKNTRVEISGGKNVRTHILKPKRIVQRKTKKSERKTDCKRPNALHEACSRKIFRILDAGEDGGETNRSMRKCCQWGRLTAGRLEMLSRVMEMMVAEALVLGRNSSGVPRTRTHFILIAIYKISMSVI